MFLLITKINTFNDNVVCRISQNIYNIGIVSKIRPTWPGIATMSRTFRPVVYTHSCAAWKYFPASGPTVTCP